VHTHKAVVSHSADSAPLTLSGMHRTQGLQLPSIRVLSPPPRRLAARLQPGTVATCAVAHGLAAGVTRLQAPARPDGQLSHHVLEASRLADTLARLMADSLPPGVRVDSVAGHLNFVVDDVCGSADQVMAPCSPETVVPPPPCTHRRSTSRRQRRRSEHASPPTAPPRSRQLVVHTRPSSFDTAEFELYRKYQCHVHGDDPSELTASAYTRFLVSSPLVPVPPGPGTPSCGFGTVHRQYWLGDVLVAVGVCDVLPTGVSSVYLFYDPQYAPLCLGKATACEEIAWVAEQQRMHCPGLQFYHLGLYIPSCRKMRYKAAFKPTQVLCPRTWQWVPLEGVSEAVDSGAMQLCQDPAGSPGVAEAPQLDPLLLFVDIGLLVRLSALRASGALSELSMRNLDRRVAHWAAGVGGAVVGRAACVCWHPQQPQKTEVIDLTGDE
jgi:arginyl-tRNA---protein transferase